MLARSWQIVATLGLPIALGTGLLLVATAVGWALARHVSLAPVRLVAWWVRRVVLPFIRCRSWWRRLVAIFLNNASILAVMVVAGRWPLAPIILISVVGVSLGIGLRVLADRLADPLPSDLMLTPCGRWRVRAGVALNLLEPPAIMLAVGLSLGYSAIPLPTERVWEVFLLWVIPATLLAAGGEALWLGEGQATREVCEDPAADDAKAGPDREP